jgi:predicted phage-related endonuclease
MAVERIPLPRGGGFPLERTEDVTASVIGALFDVHPWTTIFELYAKHRGAELPERKQTTVMERGVVLEPVVARMIKKRHRKWKITRNKFYFRDPEARIGATPDFFIEGDERGLGVLQTKTVASFNFRRDYTEENPPFWIALQNQTELMLTGARWGLIAPLVIGDFAFDVHEYEVPHHDGAQQKIRAAVAAFWQSVAECREPKPAFDRDSGIIDALYPHEAPGKVVDLRFANRMPELLETIESEKAKERDAKIKREIAEAEVKQALGDAELGIVSGWRLSWKTIHKKAHPVKATSYRQLRVNRDRQEAA